MAETEVYNPGPSMKKPRRKRKMLKTLNREFYPREEVRLVHLIVCDGPEDKAEEGVEGC